MVVVIVGVSQVSDPMESAADFLFVPYDDNVLLSVDVVYDVGKIPSLFRVTHKLLLLPDRPLPPPSLPRGSAQTVAVIVVIGYSHWQHWKEEEDEEGGDLFRNSEEPSYLRTI